MEDTDMKYMMHPVAKVELSISDDICTPKILSVIETGRYERQEMLFAQRLIKTEDRVLELGAGLGFISTVVSKSSNPAYYAAVEANEQLLPHIKRTHKKNGVTGVNVIHSAFVSDQKTLDIGHVEFGVARAFLASGIDKAGSEGMITVRVDVQDASAFIREHHITALICDIEGGELNLFRSLDFAGIQKIILETHPIVYGQAGMRDIFQILEKNGFVYNVPNSSGSVISFEKLGTGEFANQ